jgi:tetratricopeptide (TPR) repeat protein
VFRQAATISRAYPQGFYNTAILFSNRGQNDSAAHYFRVARDIASKDPSFVRDRNGAAISLAAILQQTQQHDAAVTELRQYLQWVPNDVEAKRALAVSLRATGKADEASKIDEELLEAAKASGNLSAGDLFGIGVAFFNDSKYQEAADAFARIHEMEPYNYDALANLANAYFAMKDGAKVVEYATKLVELEPLNEDNHKLLIQGHRLAENTAAFEAAAAKLFGMPTAVSLGGASADGGTIKVAGKGIGRRDATDLNTGNPVAPAATTIVFEFLSAEGEVLSSEEIQIPALEPDATFDFTATGTGNGIRAWRYRVK